jgi:anion-transporting  ArsA/GET3 family ATPase
LKVLDHRLVYVTGKGGVGKSTVAEALALVAARDGPALLVEVGRNYAEDTEGDNLWRVGIDPDEALREWLGKQVGGPALKVLARSQAFEYFVAAAPGVKELITIAKVWELAQDTRWTGAEQTYDTVVVDAPASGHGVAMLRTPDTFGDIAPGGTVKRQAGKVRAMLRDPGRTALVCVATPEEMPVNETLELQDRLVEAVGRDADAIVANRLLPQRLTRADRDALEAVADHPHVHAALTADEHARTQRTHLRRLRSGARSPVVSLPFLFAPELGREDLTDLGLRIARRV